MSELFLKFKQGETPSSNTVWISFFKNIDMGKEKKNKWTSNGNSQKKSRRPKSRNSQVAATADLQLNSQQAAQDCSNCQNKRA